MFVLAFIIKWLFALLLYVVTFIRNSKDVLSATLSQYRFRNSFRLKMCYIVFEKFEEIFLFMNM